MRIDKDKATTMADVAQVSAQKAMSMVAQRNKRKEKDLERKRRLVKERLREKDILGAQNASQFVKKLAEDVVKDMYGDYERASYTTVYISFTGKAMLLNIIESFQAETNIRLTEEQALHLACYNFIPKEGITATDEFIRAMRKVAGKTRGKSKYKVEPELNVLLHTKSFEYQMPMSIIAEYCVHLAAYYLTPGDHIMHPDTAYGEDCYSNKAMNFDNRETYELQPLEVSDHIIAQMYGRYSKECFSGIKMFKVAIQRFRNGEVKEANLVIEE